MRAHAAVAAAVAALCGRSAQSFSNPSKRVRPRRLGPSYMFFADAVVESSDASPDVKVSALDGSESAIESAARFMVEAFWLRSPQQLARGGADSVSDSARASLVAAQSDDLTAKYGERMGRRKLEALMLAAFDDENSGDLLGLVTIEGRLINTRMDMLSPDASERMLTQAVASLGPKQRREYKDASVIEIANRLLPPDVSAVCSLSNLCVSPSARRRGIAGKLCEEAERLAKEELGFDEMYLRVESGNEAAKRLYEEKLGYENVCEVGATPAMRVDAESGSFVEVESEIVVLKKQI